MALFESYDRRINQINAELAKHGISSIEEAHLDTKLNECIPGIFFKMGINSSKLVPFNII